MGWEVRGGGTDFRGAVDWGRREGRGGSRLTSVTGKRRDPERREHSCENTGARVTGVSALLGFQPLLTGHPLHGHEVDQEAGRADRAFAGASSQQGPDVPPTTELRSEQPRSPAALSRVAPQALLTDVSQRFSQAVSATRGTQSYLPTALTLFFLSPPLFKLFSLLNTFINIGHMHGLQLIMNSEYGLPRWHEL